MGAKTALLVFADGDAAGALRDATEFDRVATTELVARLLPGLEPVAVEDGSLGRNVNPRTECCTPGCSEASRSSALPSWARYSPAS